MLLPKIWIWGLVNPIEPIWQVGPSCWESKLKIRRNQRKTKFLDSKRTKNMRDSSPSRVSPSHTFSKSKAQLSSGTG